MWGRTSNSRAEDSKQTGFSMIELLVAIVLLTIVLAGTMALQVTTLRAGRDTKSTTMAVTLAEARIDLFRAIPYANLATVASEITCFDFDGTENPSCPAGVYFTRQTDVTLTGSTFEIAVTVQWLTGESTTPMQIGMRMERNP